MVRASKKYELLEILLQFKPSPEFTLFIMILISIHNFEEKNSKVRHSKLISASIDRAANIISLDISKAIRNVTYTSQAVKISRSPINKRLKMVRRVLAGTKRGCWKMHRLIVISAYVNLNTFLGKTFTMLYKK